jgi:acetyl-CoA synthetase
MLWLMSRVPGYAPVIEYCGGTEIGGSYMSSTVVQPNVPSMFSSPVLGSQLVLLDQNGNMQDGDGYCPRSRASSIDDGMNSSASRGRARSYSGTNITVSTPTTTTIVGELTIVPPALGLSTHLLNRDHYSCYYGDMPAGRNGEVLRRHGDEVELVRERAFSMSQGKLSTLGSYYRALGRCDDTMNLGGIKISSVELERVCNTTSGVLETAAIAITPPTGGPSLLLIYVVRTAPVALPPPVEVNAATMSMSDLLGAQDTTTKTANISTPAAPVALVATEAEIAELKAQMQVSIKTRLNPLFHIFKVIDTDKLPRTASNKIMRRVLRDEYVAQQEAKK